jgi:hypothetical protein
MAAPTVEKAREMRVRTEAGRLGMRLCKDRARVPRIGHLGRYRLLRGGRIVTGRHWDASLDDVEPILAAERHRLTGRAG